MEQPKKISPAIAAIIIIVLVGIAATAVIVIHNNSTSTAKTDDTKSSTTPATTKSTSSTGSSTTYKDGTYSATGTYESPEGQEAIKVTVTLSNSVITDTSLAEQPQSDEARGYQDQFASAYKSLVVGKKINEVSLSRVAGSSLTSGGFNKALATIESDAAA